MQEDQERKLAADVRLLGKLLGEAIQAQAGSTLLQDIEAMRQTAKRARDTRDTAAQPEACTALATQVAQLPAERATQVVHAFNLYFQLVNVAEDVHRARILRRRLIEGGPAAVDESFHVVVAELVAAGASREDLLATLADLHLGFVFTAHPTEARRRTTERLLAKVRSSLQARDRAPLTPIEEHIAMRELNAAVEALWAHSAQREARPEVLEEVKAGLWYVRHVLLDVVPRVHRRLCRALEAHVGSVDPNDVPMPLYFGSWMGGDRDGNPFVTDAVMERTLALHRDIALTRYSSDLEQLIDPLAADGDRLPPHPPLDAALRRAAEALPELVPELERRNPREPLRRLLSLMQGRLQRSRHFGPGAYPDAATFLEDLAVLHDLCVTMGCVALPEDGLLSLMHRVRVFGFHLVKLDVREDSRVIREVVAELLGVPDYPQQSSAARLAQLSDLRLPQARLQLSPPCRRLLSLFATMARLQGRFGRDALRTFIISMCESAADVMEVLRLAALHGIDAELDIVPLLETRHALQHAGPLLRELFCHARYKAHLALRQGAQELLVGYSDSMKESGILASRVLVLQAQADATAICAEHGIQLRIFHGRGGSVSRGGGPTYRALRALPPQIFSGDTKITEQGEIRAFHFSSPELAVRYLEQTLGAAIALRHAARQPRADKIGPVVQPALAALAEHSFRAYRDLVEAPGLLTYFNEATPLGPINALHIASRPPKRRKGRPGLSDLRAIPWVFAWSQSRQIITGWYGVGTALSAVLAVPDGQERLQSLYREDPFFRDLLDNVQMTLAKSDMGIAARYAALCRDPAARDRIFTMVQQEYEASRRAVLAVMGQDTLLAHDPTLQRSIRLRNPYVDPLSYLQVAALEHARSASEEQHRSGWQQVARAAVHGIAAGLRNTG
ncbi:MAG: phosphoenolpyruvate carboxylase [Polyangiales bacterium]